MDGVWLESPAAEIEPLLHLRLKHQLLLGRAYPDQDG